MRLSVQLYTLRDDLAVSVPDTLKKVREIGLEYVELAGWYEHSAAEWKVILDDLGLKASGAHVGIDQFENDRTAAVADLQTAGVKHAIIPWLNGDRRGAWTALGEQLDALGASLKADGLELAYHNHDFEFVGDGLSELYAAASAENLKAELDLAWVKIGHADPVEWIQKMKGRLPLVHLKDFDPTVEPQWVPAGQGTMDWDAIVPVCEAQGVEFGVIELDAYSGAPIDAVRASFEYFTSKGLR